MQVQVTITLVGQPHVEQNSTVYHCAYTELVTFSPTTTLTWAFLTSYQLNMSAVMGNIGPNVMTLRTELSEVCTRMTEGNIPQYVKHEQAKFIVSSSKNKWFITAWPFS